MDREVGVDPSALAYGVPMPVPGDVIEGKYRVDAVVGRGGMSVVYRATHLSLDQPVAIKVLSAAALVLPEYVTRLEREARASSQIRSEHVVRVFDIGKLPGSGIPYLVMEHLDGADLAATLSKRGPLPVGLVVEAIAQTCEALAEAHALGIIHRDLKPANLFLTESVDGSPCVKVLDFGISRMLKRPAAMQLTDPGTVLGTPSYMAPEQMEANERVDARSDIWALGTIMYELLVGRPPWTGDSLPQIFVKIMRSKTPRPSQHRSGVPHAIDAIVARCLAIDPEDRFQSVAELAEALSQIGSPRTRDSAARTARVWVKRRNESGMSGVLPARSEERASSSRIFGQLAAALAVGVAIGLGTVVLDRPPSERSLPAAAMMPASMPDLSEAPEEDAAVLFTPIIHPQPPPAAPSPPEPPKKILRRDTSPPPSLANAPLAAAPDDER